jgi:ethanolamine utilization microcompartment shell protein EutS
MGTQFWFFYDIAIILVILLGFYNGFKKGFLKTIILTVGSIAVFTVSWGFSQIAADTIYDNYFKEKNTQMLSNALSGKSYTSDFILKLQDMGVDLSSDEINEILQNGSVDELAQAAGLSTGETDNNAEEVFSSAASQTISHLIESTAIPYSQSISDQILDENPEVLDELLLQIVSPDSTSIVSKIENDYIRKVEIMIIRILITALASSVLMIIVDIATKKIKIRRERIVLNALDRFSGGIVGIVGSLFSIYIIISVVHLLVAFGKEQLVFFNNDVIDKTVIFGYLYHFILNIQ